MTSTFLLGILGSSLAEEVGEFDRETLYPGTVLTTPSGKKITIKKLRFAYTEEANQRLLGEIARLRGVVDAYASVDTSSKEYQDVLKEEIRFYKGMIVQRDIWIEQEKSNTEAYRQLLKDLLNANKSLKRRFPNITKLVFGTVLLKEGLDKIK